MSFLYKTVQWSVRAVFFVGGWIFELTQRVEDKFICLFKRPEYIRKGGCQMSGMCCSNLGLLLPKAWSRRAWIIRYFVWWHRYRYKFHFLGIVDNLLVYECGYVTKDNQCSIYPWRPRLCREYPKVQLWDFPKLHKGCGFYFIQRGRADFAETLEREKKKFS